MTGQHTHITQLVHRNASHAFQEIASVIEISHPRFFENETPWNRMSSSQTRVDFQGKLTKTYHF